jgi:hypothetical protein
MSEKLVTEYEVRGGAQRGTRLVLYGDRLVLQSDSAMEVLPLARLASIRIAFERNPARLTWAIVLLLVAALLWAVSGPLQEWSAAAVARVGDSARRESFDAVLVTVYAVIGGVARALPFIAGALALGGAALAVLYWLGRTTLLLTFAATEREISVLGRDQDLAHFADTLATQLVAAGRAP